MIIDMLLNLIFNIFKLLTMPINIPSFPIGVLAYIEEYMLYIQSGVGLLDYFVDVEIALILLGIIIAIDIGVALYHFVMWIIRKIPMLGMS